MSTSFISNSHILALSVRYGMRFTVISQFHVSQLTIVTHSDLPIRTKDLFSITIAIAKEKWFGANQKTKKVRIGKQLGIYLQVLLFQVMIQVALAITYTFHYKYTKIVRMTNRREVTVIDFLIKCWRKFWFLLIFLSSACFHPTQRYYQANATVLHFRSPKELPFASFSG